MISHLKSVESRETLIGYNNTLLINCTVVSFEVVRVASVCKETTDCPPNDLIKRSYCKICEIGESGGYFSDISTMRLLPRARGKKTAFIPLAGQNMNTEIAEFS